MACREHQRKVGLVWHDDGTISYYRRKFWYFEPQMSVGPLTDSILTLNIPMVTAVNYAQGSWSMEYGLSDMFQTLEVSWASQSLSQFTSHSPPPRPASLLTRQWGNSSLMVTMIPYW